ncbi:hypothetical protein L596_026911 [Steinernema carpocapsae]|uniref:glucuronosyltransferase n=1 Tax=Steinernema carpocapsae TaxID=34508 RepID=A0A4U5M2R7_STECR|nr:hypothetical protein L596_026911 [Steinernema carpocapsae]
MPSLVRLLLLLPLLGSIDSLKVFVYNPSFGHSHVRFVGRLADILSEEGMEVTSFMPLMNPLIKSNGTKYGKIVTCEGSPALKDAFAGSFISWDTHYANPLAEKALMDMVTKVHSHQCEHTLLQKDVLEQLKKEKFDLGITEIFDLCAMGRFRMLLKMV